MKLRYYVRNYRLYYELRGMKAHAQKKHADEKVQSRNFIHMF